MKRLNITEKIDNLRLVEGAVIREDKINLELAEDPAYLSLEINRELVDIKKTLESFEKYIIKCLYLLTILTGLLFVLILKNW